MNAFLVVVAGVVAYQTAAVICDVRADAHHAQHRLRGAVAPFRVRVRPAAPLRVAGMPSVESDAALLDAIAAEAGPRFLAALTAASEAHAAR